MATLVTVSDLRVHLDQVPVGTEQDNTLQVMLDGAEATVLRYLTGVIIVPPAPADLTQIICELASSYWLTKGTASRLETVGADGQGGFEFVGGLTPEQKGALRQIRIELDGVAF